jgi:hypothetical protein
VAGVWSGGDPGVADEVVEGGVAGAGGCAQSGRGGRAGVGELGQAGNQQAPGEPGEEEGLAEAGGGDLVAEAVRDALDKAVDAEPPQVAGDLPAGHGLRVKPRQGREVAAQVAVGETIGQQPEDAQGGEQGLHAGAGDGHPGSAGAGRGDDRLGEGGHGGCAFGGVVADPLDVKQAPAGGEADLLQSGEMRQPLGHAEVTGLADGRFGPERLAQLAVLLDFGVLAAGVQARGHPAGDDAGAEPGPAPGACPGG